MMMWYCLELKYNSKYFEKGLNLAESLGGIWDGETMVLKIPESKLMKAYEPLIPLFLIIQNSTNQAFQRW